MATRGRIAGSRSATCSSISMITSDGTREMGEGGGGVPSIMGSAGGMEWLENEAMSSAVGSTIASFSGEPCAVFGTVTDAFDGLLAGFEVEGGKNFCL